MKALRVNENLLYVPWEKIYDKLKGELSASSGAVLVAGFIYSQKTLGAANRMDWYW